jgi:TonB dependent receptor-like, beta-barrel
MDFAGQVGLQGVTHDPRDVGFPQISTRSLYTAMGDPTSFVFRDNRHFELYDNVTADRGAHRLKFGASYFHLRLRPEQPDNARGAFTYTGQFTGNAFADFLLGFPTSATSGIGRGDEDGRTNWLHLYAQDDWRMRDNLTVNLGLRYEYNQHMYDVSNRLSSIDLSTPGGRFVIASDEAGNINSAGQALLPLIPIAYVTSAEAGWNRVDLAVEPRTSGGCSAPRVPGRCRSGCESRSDSQLRGATKSHIGSLKRSGLAIRNPSR